MTEKIITLKDRAILEIAGGDRKKFLQGLITNDVNKASEKELIFTVMLNAQGRFLYDFFIFERGEALIIDCLSSRRDEIFKKLNFYKLRSEVTISKNDELLACQSYAEQKHSTAFDLTRVSQVSHDFLDPRHEKLGHRIYISKSSVKNFVVKDDSLYHFQRISNKIPESELDLTYEKSFILEFGFDDLHAIDYQKGCYIGQELTARTHYLGEIRKKIFHVKITDSTSPEKNSEITCEGKSVGMILSTILHENTLHALALIKLQTDKNFDELQSNLECLGQKILIIS